MKKVFFNGRNLSKTLIKKSYPEFSAIRKLQAEHAKKPASPNNNQPQSKAIEKSVPEIR
jgi:hypothetical protein